MVRVVLALLLTAACGSPATTEQLSVSVRDSAGIVIIDYPMAVVAAVPTWSLGPVVSSLGGPEADAVHDMTGVESALLEDSAFIVSDASTMQLRRFSFSGEFLGTGAGSGEGPGELASVGTLLTTAKGIAVLDFARRLLVHYTPTLQFSDQLSLRDLPGGIRYGVLALDASGGLITLGGAEGFPPQTPSGEIQRAQWVVERLLPTGRQADTLFSVPGGEFYSIGGSGTRLRRFGVSSFVQKSPTGFLSGDGARWEVLVRDSSGNVQRIIRLAVPRRPVTESMRTEQLRLDHREIDELPPGGFKGIRRIAELDFANPLFPDSLPAFDRFKVGADGTLWVREGMAVTDSVQHWFVFHGDSLVGRLPLPGPHTLLDVHRDRVLVRRADSLDVGYIELRAIVPSPCEQPGR